MDDKTTVYLKPIHLPMTVFTFECPECRKVGLTLSPQPNSYMCTNCETHFKVEVLS